MLKLKQIGMLTAAVVLFALLWQVQPTRADYAKGVRSSGYYVWQLPLDSTTISPRDTLTAQSGKSTPLGWFNGVQDFSNVSGYFLLSYSSLDTGSAAADTASTSLDTVIVELRTGVDGASIPYKVVWTDTILSIKKHIHADTANGDYVAFNLSDSALYDNVYFWIDAGVHDSDYAISRASGGINYRIDWKFWAK